MKNLLSQYRLERVKGNKYSFCYFFDWSRLVLFLFFSCESRAILETFVGLVLCFVLFFFFLLLLFSIVLLFSFLKIILDHVNSFFDFSFLFSLSCFGLYFAFLHFCINASNLLYIAIYGFYVYFITP